MNRARSTGWLGARAGRCAPTQMILSRSRVRRLALDVHGGLPTHQGGFMAVTAVDPSSHSAVSAFPADTEVPLAAQLSALRLFVEQHPFWQSPLMTAFSQGTLSRDDLQYVFSQYHL